MHCLWLFLMEIYFNALLEHSSQNEEGHVFEVYEKNICLGLWISTASEFEL